MQYIIVSGMDHGHCVRMPMLTRICVFSYPVLSAYFPVLPRIDGPGREDGKERKKNLSAVECGCLPITALGKLSLPDSAQPESPW